MLKHNLMVWVYFYHFFRLIKVVRKKKSPGVIFKPFYDSPNMKMYSSKLVSFTLVKVLEEMFTQYKFNLFTN